jgi:hypothetical protein
VALVRITFDVLDEVFLFTSFVVGHLCQFLLTAPSSVGGLRLAERGLMPGSVLRRRQRPWPYLVTATGAPTAGQRAMSGLTVTSLVTSQKTMPLTCEETPTRSRTSCYRARARPGREKVSELRKHLSARILDPGPVQCRESGPGRYRGHGYASDLGIYHEVELRRLELRTSDRKITLAVARQRTLGR